MPGIHSLNFDDATALWADLVAAYYGYHGFGGNVAQLYAHRFGCYSPTATHPAGKREYERDSAVVLHALLVAFKGSYDCDLEVDAQPFGDWVAERPFGWRSTVRVTPHNPSSREEAARRIMRIVHPRG